MGENQHLSRNSVTHNLASPTSAVPCTHAGSDLLSCSSGKELVVHGTRIANTAYASRTTSILPYRNCAGNPVLGSVVRLPALHCLKHQNFHDGENAKLLVASSISVLRTSSTARAEVNVGSSCNLSDKDLSKTPTTIRSRISSCFSCPKLQRAVSEYRDVRKSSIGSPER